MDSFGIHDVDQRERIDRVGLGQVRGQAGQEMRDSDNERTQDDIERWEREDMAVKRPTARGTYQDGYNDGAKSWAVQVVAAEQRYDELVSDLQKSVGTWGEDGEASAAYRRITALAQGKDGT